jgi:stage II sporulation protein D
LGDLQILAEVPAQGSQSLSLARLAQLKGRFVVRRAGGAFVVEQAGKTVATSSARRLRLISVNPYNLIDMGQGVYRGGLHFIAETDGDVLAVNVLGVEDYLRGVLPYEMGKVDRDGLEALKAQAIVARTYAYKRMLGARNAEFHLHSDVQDQVYKGVRGEYLMSDRAVWETRGMAVMHADSLALCYYFSTCGGRTASKHEVWGGDSIAYLVSRPDTDGLGEPWCQASKYMAWTQEWTRPQLAGILKRNLRSAGVADFPAFTGIQNLAITQRATCGRARLLNITTNRGSILVKGDKTRWALRPPGDEEKILPSAWFTLKAAGDKITAEGKGFGHGVGLCQAGAVGRAKSNQNFVQIIRAYYQGVDVVEFR